MADKMADIRCQMCGKPNPGTSTECKYCGARLKPLIASQASSPAPSAKKESDAPLAGSSQEDTLDWLRSLGQDEGEPLTDSGSTDDLPDWLGGGAQTSPSANSQSDWMNELGGGDLLDDSSVPNQSGWDTPEADSQLDQWLPKESKATPTTSRENNLDDFLSGKKSSTGATDDLPSWLLDKEDEKQEKTVPLTNLPLSSSPEEDDWLNTIGNEDSVTATVSDWKFSSSPPHAPNEELPSWLSDSGPIKNPPAEPSGFDDDLPSWLGGGPAIPADTSPGFSTSPDLDGEFPDWLDNLSSKTGMTGKLGDMPKWLDENEPTTSSDQAEELSMDWLASLGDTPDEQPESKDWGKESGAGTRSSALGGLTIDPEDSFISEVGRSENPDWLQGLQESETEDAETTAGFAGFHSSWGFEQKPKQENQQETETSDEQSSASEQAEDSGILGGLPSWVRAFRPMDGADIASEYTEGELERVGPLAGLRGLLTPEADITKTAKPPAYSDVLQVSTSQQTNTQLLQSLIEAENIPQTLPEPSPLTSQRILRIVFGVILILVMLFPLISGTEIIPLPQQPMPQELQAIENLSNSAPLDRPILVAFDYEPGLSGELEAATKALFDHWMERGIPLAIVSTSPIGTGLGERQISYLLNKFPYEHHYVYGENYINLGYIAGGTAGLANFASNPREALKMAFDNRPIWELLDYEASNPWLSPVLQPIIGVADFPMTVVLTDNPETARNWIEQVEPALRRNSLVMIVSAQAEPFVRPYFQNPDPAQRQVEGLLVGLRGGAWYEQDQGSFGVARLYWDAFGVGLLVAVVLILAGGGYNYLDQLSKVRRQARRAKARK